MIFVLCSFIFIFDVIYLLYAHLQLVFDQHKQDVVEAVSVANSSGGNSSVEAASPALSFIEMMVEEQLPWVIRFPHMGYNPLSVCRSDSMQEYTLF